jgi:hypothetical protein
LELNYARESAKLFDNGRCLRDTGRRRNPLHLAVKNGKIGRWSI